MIKEKEKKIGVSNVSQLDIRNETVTLAVDIFPDSGLGLYVKYLGYLSKWHLRKSFIFEDYSLVFRSLLA